MRKAILTIVFAFVATAAFSEIAQREKQVLIDFYNATNGAQWYTTWNLNSPVDTWEGITLENNSVTGISMLFNNINGQLPSSLGELENLKVLELSFNNISGNLPESLGNLKNLEILAFNGNNLSGTVPASLGNLKNLKQLHLSSNQLNGTLPESLGDLENIEVFNVFENNLSGNLPSGLAKCRQLKELIIAENNFKNAGEFSVILLSNSGVSLNLNETTPQPMIKKSVIAVQQTIQE